MRALGEWALDITIALVITTILYWIIKSVGIWTLIRVILEALSK